MMTAVSGDPGKSVARRTLAILGAFDLTHPRLSLSELARRTGLPLATTYRLASELVAWRALDRDGNGGYSIGIRLWEAGLLAPVATDLRAAATPFLQALQSRTGENVQLAVRDEFGGLYVEKLSGDQAVPIFSRVGTRMPMHATAVGKMLLATAEPSFVEAHLRQPLVRFTKHTITDPGVLRRDLRLAAAQGYSLTREETMYGANSVAVPIPSQDGSPTLALGIVASSSGTNADLYKLVPLLRVQADRIARRIAEPSRELPGQRQAPPPLPGVTNAS
ncbi:DNA-binding IclR family transcriptional regulator [Kibdelosporangium banguiense]|uniref:DNA-binding IclR family transcriptional regulator n=1 Tax=Kibdelosporangium banguiense TaxID=1365924 RepID=A0ABS4TXZ8_9PSEU|nr:IclR family transcriptional regulator [Kibdelosporangium banguiense]MBP2329254.1 DNA-binding IclR family transcriptional regulator [Kibdelosporangium banguiense]